MAPNWRAGREAVRVGEVGVDATSLVRPVRQPALAQKRALTAMIVGWQGSIRAKPVAGSRKPSMSRSAGLTMRVSTAATPSIAAMVAARRLRRAHRRGEDVGEAIAFVIGRAGLLERAVGADGEDQRGDAAGHHQRDRERLAPTAGRGRAGACGRARASAYQLISDGARRSLIRSRPRLMRPSRK